MRLLPPGFVDGGASSPARCRIKIFDFDVGSFTKGET